MAPNPNVATIQMTGLDKLARSLELHDQNVRRVIAGQFLRAEGDATTYAKRNAPWTDRTGNARAGLHSKASFNQNEFELLVAHSVDYGIWLETRFSGKYSIIGHTINYVGNLLMQRIEASLKHMAEAS